VLAQEPANPLPLVIAIQQNALERVCVQSCNNLKVHANLCRALRPARRLSVNAKLFFLLTLRSVLSQCTLFARWANTLQFSTKGHGSADMSHCSALLKGDKS